jgi:hypothetical protein
VTLASVRPTEYKWAATRTRQEGATPMANHLTPTELAREAGLERKEVLSKCVELGVPVFQGRIDKSLFLASLREQVRPQVASLKT